MINQSLDDQEIVYIGTQAEERLMVAPLLARDQVVGMMAVWRFGAKPPFTQAELDFLVGLSQQAAAAIEGARLLEAQREAQCGSAGWRRSCPLVTYVDAPFAVADPRASLGGRLYISPQCEAMLGYASADWDHSKLWETILHPDDPRTGCWRRRGSSRRPARR